MAKSHQVNTVYFCRGLIMHMNTIIWVYVAVHLADESAVGAINRPLRSITGFMCSSVLSRQPPSDRRPQQSFGGKCDAPIII